MNRVEGEWTKVSSHYVVDGSLIISFKRRVIISMEGEGRLRINDSREVDAWPVVNLLKSLSILV